MNLLAKKIAHLLVKNANDGFYEDEVRYGLEIVLGGLLQIVIIMAVALFLGIGKEVLALTISAALYRRYSGGAHCQAYYRCTITSLINFILLAYISRHIPINYLPIYNICLIILTIIIVHRYVPVDNPAYPITDHMIIKKRKQRSYGVLLIVMLVNVITAYIIGEKLFAIALLLGLAWQNITLLPWGQAYIHLWDQFFNIIEVNLKRKEEIKCLQNLEI